MVVIGDVNGTDGLDLWAAEITGETSIWLFPGGAGTRMTTVRQKTYTQAAAGDLNNGLMRIGDITGDGTGDLIVGSPTKDTIYIVSGTAADQTALSTVAKYVGTSTVNSNVWDFANNPTNDVEMYDLDGDDVLDLFIGDIDAATGNRVLVAKGPLGFNDLSEGSFYRVYRDGDVTVGSNILFGDIDGDGLDDFILGSHLELYVLAGLQ